MMRVQKLTTEVTEKNRRALRKAIHRRDAESAEEDNLEETFAADTGRQNDHTESATKTN
jgi:hypothetical protein